MYLSIYNNDNKVLDVFDNMLLLGVPTRRRPTSNLRPSFQMTLTLHLSWERCFYCGMAIAA